MARPVRRTPLLAWLVLPILALASLPACSGSGDTLTIYSGRTSNLIKPVLDRFADESGINIEFRPGDSADLALLVTEEGDRSPADVILSQSPGALGFLNGDGRLRRLPEGLLDRVDRRFRGTDGRWVGLSGRVRVLVYNTELVRPSELPASVFDLTAPRYRGRVALAPSNGSFQDFVTAMRQLEGEGRTRAWLEGMADNDARAVPTNNDIVQRVARGEVPMGLVNHYYNERAKAEDPGIPTENHFFPDRDVGSVILETGVGILDTADSPEEARRLVRFLLSEDAQRFFSEETFEYPLVTGVDPPAGLVPLERIEAPSVDLGSLGGGLRRTLQLIEASGLES